MTSGLTWLNDLMTWLARWVPRLVLVTSRHRAIVFRPGDVTTEHGPGLLVYWPIIHVLQIVSIQLRTNKIAPQLHGSEVLASVIVWRIVDARQALLSLNDAVATVESWTLAALADAYGATETSAGIGVDTARRVRDRILEHGIEIVAVHITQRGWTIPIKTMTDWANHESRQLDGTLQ
jgi:regulator of protease activity HflC (stomatin/prohibitin superfamily)